MKGKRTVEQATKATVKETKATILVTGCAAQATVKSVQAAVKAVAAAVKTTIATVKGTAALIAAGGWVAVLIILLICAVISEIFDNPFLPLLFLFNLRFGIGQILFLYLLDHFLRSNAESFLERFDKIRHGRKTDHGRDRLNLCDMIAHDQITGVVQSQFQQIRGIIDVQLAFEHGGKIIDGKSRLLRNLCLRNVLGEVPMNIGDRFLHFSLFTVRVAVAFLGAMNEK